MSPTIILIITGYCMQDMGNSMGSANVIFSVWLTYFPRVWVLPKHKTLYAHLNNTIVIHILFPNVAD